jgi:uroporphyrinogen decarboxylase
MTSRERFFAAMENRGYDRMPVKHYAVAEVDDMLKKHFGFQTDEELMTYLGDDFRNVKPVYCGPELECFPDGDLAEGLWGEKYTKINHGNGIYLEATYLPFAEVEDPEELKGYRWPTADWYSYDTIEAQCLALPDKVRTLGTTSDPDFINGISRCRGVEQVLIDLATEDPVLAEIMKKRFEFVYSRNERSLQAAKGMIDVVCFGEDLGDQRNLILNPKVFDNMFAGYFEKLFAQAHRYGARTMMHSCGSVYKLIPRLIDLGLDILDVVQVDAMDMDIRKLHNEYKGRIVFCGSMSVQSTLPFGSTEDVRREVRLRQKLFDSGGMIIGPTHRIQAGTPIENILAMYDEIGSLSRQNEIHQGGK